MTLVVFIWQGKGYIIPVCFLAVLIPLAFTISDVYKPLSETFLPSVSFAVTGLVSYIFGEKWRKAEGIIVFDKATNQEVEVKEKNTFFWIDVYHWSYICWGLSLISQIFWITKA